MTETFCIYPWLHTFIEPDGEMKLCCVAKDQTLVDAQGRPLSLQHHSLREAWNSEALREVRRKMLAGEKVEACAHCDLEKEAGHKPYRAIVNEMWITRNPERETWLRRIEESAQASHRVDHLPAYFDLRPGNVCNLKCRMCSSKYSTLIGNDPIQKAWAPRQEKIVEDWGRFGEGTSWYESEDTLLNEILETPDQIRMFYLAGGEPLINPAIRRLIRVLIDRGLAKNIILQFSTNLTVFPRDFLQELSIFRKVKLLISADGYGSVYDYIRYPGRWSKLEPHLGSLHEFPHLEATITPAVQVYNVLDLRELLEFCDRVGIPHYLNTVYAPRYLSIRVLPQKAKSIAAQRLREYARTCEATSESASRIQHVLQELEQECALPVEKARRKLMLFTNDMDRSRDQSFRDTLPELHRLFVQDGMVWTDETRFARPSEVLAGDDATAE